MNKCSSSGGGGGSERESGGVAARTTEEAMTPPVWLFTKCLMVVFPSGRLSSECQRIRKKKEREKRKKNGGQLSAFRSHSLLLSHTESPHTRVTDGCLTPVEDLPSSPHLPLLLLLLLFSFSHMLIYL